ncbi:MAG: amino acid adenylation domain-containing protein [Jatrophihabitantaceae bacterium]
MTGTTTQPRAQQLDQLWNSTRAEYPDRSCLTDLIAAQAEATPAALAVRFRAEEISYRQLLERAGRLAHELRNRGVTTDDVVGVHAVRGAELLVGLLGILLAGAAYLPLDPDYPAERLNFAVRDAGVRLVLVSGPQQAPPGCPVPAIRLDVIEAAAAGWPGTPPAAGLRPENLAYVIYTSGSTGRPKGVAVPHRGLVNRLAWMQARYALTPGERVLQKTPISFDVSVWELFWPLICGATVVLAEPGGHRDAHYLAELMAAERISTVHFVPSMLAQFLDQPALPELPALRRVVCSGEALPVALMTRARTSLPGELHNLYGPTEASIDVTAYRCEPDPAATSVPIGSPIANTQVHVFRPDGQLAEPGELGEIYLAGVGLARGYLGNAALTAERFLPDPCDGGRMYRTGDLGRWRSDGVLEYEGRVDFQVKIRGNRIELGEVEVALRRHPAVRAAVVLARPVAGHDQLVGYLQAGQVSSDELRATLAATLPDYMVPSVFCFLDEFPVTANGKLDRAALPEPLRVGQAVSRRPQTPEQALLAEIWQQALDIAEVGVTQDLLQLGGDSIVALRIATAVRARGYELTPQAVLTERTIERLAGRLRRIDGAGPEPSADQPSADQPAAEQPGGDQDEYPLTAMQAGMLFHSESDPASRDYFQQTVLEIDGPWHPEVIGEALRWVVDRHPALRSTFDLYRTDHPVQRARSGHRLPVQALDWRAADLDRDALLTDWLAADQQRGLGPVADQPPLRLQLLRWSDSRTVAVLSYHHAVLDGWSLVLLVEQWQQAWRQLAAGQRPDQRPGVPFRRYVDYLATLDRAELDAFWRPRLAAATAAAPLRLTGGCPGELETSEVSCRLEGPALARLRQTATEFGITFGSLVHAAWAVLLTVCTGSGAVTFGSTVAGRPAGLAGIDELVGNCVNTVPMSLRLSPNLRLDEIAGLVQQEILDRTDFELMPLAALQEQAGLRTGQRLFDSIVVLENYGRIDQGDVRFVETRERTGYPMVLVVDGPRSAVRLRLRHRRDLCDTDAAAGMLRDLTTVLKLFAAEPGARLADVCLVDEERSPEVLGSWNDTARPFEAPETIHAGFEAQVRRTPDAVAVAYLDQTLTYAELNARANRLAHWLLSCGAGRASRVGVCLHRGPALLISFLAVLKAGAAYVPLASDNPPTRLRSIADSAGMHALITERALEPLSQDWAVSAVLIDELDLADLPDHDPQIPAGGQDLAYLIYTSGSTGRPKGVACPHAGLMNYLLNSVTDYASIGTGGAPLFSSYGFDMVVPNLYVPLLIGQQVRIIPELPDAAQLVAEVARHAPYCFVKLTPGQLALLIAQLSPAEAQAFAGTLVVGADAFPGSLLHAWRALDPDTVMFNEYGPTEASVANSLWQGVGADSAEPLPIGRPIANTTMYVLDRWLNPLPVGVVGEIYIGGAACVRGYDGMPALTASQFLPDPFHPGGGRMYATGDQGRWDADGNIAFLGRQDSQLKIRGYRVEGGEVETALERHQQVRRALVTAHQQRLAAFVLPEPGQQLDPAAVRSYAKSLLPDYMVPALVTVLDRLPLNANGKVDRSLLPQPVVDDVVEPAAALVGEPVRQLCEVLSEVLGAQVRPTDNFFELGGDSLLTLKVVAGARRRGLAVTPQAVFRHPTPMELATAVTATGSVERPPSEPAGGDVPLTPIQQWFFDQQLADLHHYNQSVTIRFDTTVDRLRLATALAALIERHDPLRLRFCCEGGRWRQYLQPAPVAGAADELVEVLDPISDAGRWEAASQLQGSLDPVAGPVIRAGVLDRPGGGADVVIAAHHLCVDTLSWPILLADLAAAYAGEPLPEPAGEGFVQWARTTGAHPSPLAVASRRCAGAVADTREHRTSLDEPTTAALLAVAASYPLRVEDLLVTALARAGTELAAGPVVIDVERHGRGPAVSEAVGWFTSVFPLRFQATDDDRQALLDTKQRLRELTGAGSSSQGGEMVLNYHGRQQSETSYGAVFRQLAEPLGAEKAPRQRRTHALEIEAAVRDGRLWLDWLHAEPDMSADRIARLAELFGRTLTRLLAALPEFDSLHTPADYPYAELTAAELAELECDGAGAIEEILALTSMQSAMVMHSLLAPSDGAYLEQQRYRLTGRIDEPAFVRAWQQAVDRHPALRSTVHWELAAGAVQAVRVTGRLDWRELPADPESALADERAEGFDFTASPPLRLWSRQRSATELDFVFSFHHAVLDGWSVAVLLEEILQRYQAILAGSPLPAPPEPELARLAGWLAHRHDPAEAAFWQAHLAGVSVPTALPAPTAAPSEPSTPSSWVDLRLSAAETQRIRDGLSRQRITLSTLAHAGWAALLATEAGVGDVVFGSAVSGRSAADDQVRDVVGMLMNTLPVRITVPDVLDRDWLTALQQQLADLRGYEQSSLIDIAGWTGNDAAQLFHSILTVENIRRSGWDGPDSQLRSLGSADQTGYPLTVLLYDDEEYALRVVYRTDYCDAEHARDLGRRMRELLGALAAAEPGEFAIRKASDSDRRQHRPTGRQ